MTPASMKEVLEKLETRTGMVMVGCPVCHRPQPEESLEPHIHTQHPNRSQLILALVRLSTGVRPAHDSASCVLCKKMREAGRVHQ